MRRAYGAVVAVLLAGGLAGCGPTADPGPAADDQATTSEETPMSSEQVRQAAEAEQPVTESKLREVAALLRPDLDQLEAERPRWLRGGTAACTWDASALSYIAKGNIPVESSKAAADELVAQLPDTWTPNEKASTGGNARYFEDPDGYLLMVSHQSDPDFALLSVESPCHG